MSLRLKNPTSAATREVVGFRLSAENILGHMSAGTVNDKDPATDKSTGGGINSFSGYLKVTTTPVMLLLTLRCLEQHRSDYLCKDYSS